VQKKSLEVKCSLIMSKSKTFYFLYFLLILLKKNVHEKCVLLKESNVI
jgi:hypothetical protein